MNPQHYLYTPMEKLPHLSLCGEVNIPSPNKHFKRTSNEWILYIITDGSMCIQEEQKQYHLTKGDILILSPHKCHFGLPVNDHVHYLYLHFHWDKLEELLLTFDEYQSKKIEFQEKFSVEWEQENTCDCFLIPKYLHPAQSIFWETLEQARSLVHTVPTAPHQHTMNDCLFYLLLLRLSRAEVYQLLPQSSVRLFSVLPVITYLKEHYSQKITSQKLEETFHHNFDYMNRRFKETTGHTIFAFLEKYRIEKGKQLLESRQFTITEIAASIGFCNSFYFSKVFKKHEHITPSEYQKGH